MVAKYESICVSLHIPVSFQITGKLKAVAYNLIVIAFESPI